MNFAAELDLFRKRVGDRRARALILLGSRQPNTAALLVGALQPQRVAFLLTPETTDFPQQVADLLGRDPDPDWLVKTAHYTDINQIYRQLRAVVIDAWSDLARSEILVDLTAGTKIMSVGLAKAAYILDLGTIYIESDYSQNQVVPGSQRLITPPDPYEVFGDLEAEAAQRAFNAYDYVSAGRIYADLARRVPMPADRLQYEALAELATAYTQWDAFDVAAAATLQRLLARPLPPVLTPYQQTLAQQQAALERLGQTTRALNQPASALATLADLDAVLPLLGSLHANAMRRVAQQRYDTAALLRYRCLELMSQHRLATYGVWTERPDLDALKQRMPQLDARYRQVEAAVGFRERGLQPNRDGSYSAITLLNGYMLLKALDDPLLAQAQPIDIKQRSFARNKSILAHGFRQITEAEYHDFAAIVDQLLDQFFALAGRSRQEWESLYRFVTL
ncbi:TIGR02710 family CRISPR-associated CARF protein [Chloroflexus sp.]|uniref:TIGR02710 family CRISPR-associated CARF protein n=1 Tax=Chloroflexus sp. TaxID=1904827 RepID=UPI0026079F23|nr:TIGR02710 family CRISPR-associated CARF protein [uncultured Chloroflexus sp.]